MAEKPKQVEIGFSGGQVTAVRLLPDRLEELRRALASTDKLSGEAAGWYELESEDGAMSLDLRQVVFVRTEAGEHRVGFIDQ